MAIDAEELTRRDFIILAANAFVAVGGAVALWPFIDQVNPDAGALALASIEVDIAPVKVGQAITVLWRGKPVFIPMVMPPHIVPEWYFLPYYVWRRHPAGNRAEALPEFCPLDSSGAALRPMLTIGFLCLAQPHRRATR